MQILLYIFTICVGTIISALIIEIIIIRLFNYDIMSSLTHRIKNKIYFNPRNNNINLYPQFPLLPPSDIMMDKYNGFIVKRCGDINTTLNGSMLSIVIYNEYEDIDKIKTVYFDHFDDTSNHAIFKHNDDTVFAKYITPDRIISAKNMKKHFYTFIIDFGAVNADVTFLSNTK